MDTIEILKTRRSVRRFAARPVEPEKLAEIMECARFYPTAANLQPLKFALLNGENAEFALERLRWAAYLPEFEPAASELPRTLLLILGDRSISRDFQFSAGAAANQIMLAAHSLGLASCCLGMSDQTRQQILEKLKLHTQPLELICAIALGYSTQSSRTVDMADTCKYSLDEQENFLVPKRTAEEIWIAV